MFPFLAGLSLPVAFFPSYNGAMAYRWVVVACLVAVIAAVYARRVHWTLTHTVYAMFVGWCAFGLLWTDFPRDWVAGLGIVLAIGAFFLAGFEHDDSEPLFIGLALGVGVNLVFMTLQKLGHVWWLDAIGPAGLYGNSNYLASVAVVSLVGLLACCRMKFWPLALMPFAVLLLSQARATLLSLAAAFCVWLWTKSRLLAVAYVLLGAAVLPLLIRHRGNTAWERVVVWKDTLENSTFLGHGIGSFHQWYPTFGNINTYVVRPENAHNDYVELLFETGVPGLVLFALFLALVFSPRTRESIALAAIMMEAAVAFPLHLPTTVVLFGFLAGRSLRVKHELRRAAVGLGGLPAFGYVAGRPRSDRISGYTYAMDARLPQGAGASRYVFDQSREARRLRPIEVWSENNWADGRHLEDGPEQRGRVAGAGLGSKGERRGRHGSY